MKRHPVNILRKLLSTITLLALLLSIAFTSCTEEDLHIPENNTELIVESRVTCIDEVTTRGDSRPEYWREYIRQIATGQHFDNFEIVNFAGEVKHQWSAEELLIEYSSPKVLVLLSENLCVTIPWEDIITIVRISKQTVTEQVMCKAE